MNLFLTIYQMLLHHQKKLTEELHSAKHIFDPEIRIMYFISLKNIPYNYMPVHHTISCAIEFLFDKNSHKKDKYFFSAIMHK